MTRATTASADIERRRRTRWASISFDRPSSFLATLERPELAAFGILLDQKIDAIVAAVSEENITSHSRSIMIDARSANHA